MKRALVLSAVVMTALSSIAADAADRRRSARIAEPGLTTHPTSSYYRSTGPRVKGFVQRRGGYSYSWGDTINTYGDSRTRYGSVNSYRDPNLDRQTSSGPFDHGFFFDSGMGRIGGSSPYLH